MLLHFISFDLISVYFHLGLFSLFSLCLFRLFEVILQDSFEACRTYLLPSKEDA